MQAQDNKHTINLQTFNDYRDPKSRSRKNHKVSKILKNETHFAHVVSRRMRKPSHRPRLKKVPYSDHPFSARIRIAHSLSDSSLPMHQRAVFKKREITTIQEEVLHCKHSKSHSAFKEKAYKDKVASLKTVVKRLKEMCLAKPEVLQNKLPEEIMKLFSDIQI